MRKLTSFIAAMLISASATFAQAPQGFSYQAVVRDAQNAIVANQTVEVTLTILQGTTADFAQAVFSEKHNAKTNANGLFTLIVGSVEPEKFAAINWAAGNVFLKTETDYGTSVTQMLSVPFALYAAKAAEADMDLSGYALKSDIPVAPDLSGYALKTEIPAEPDLNGYAKTADIEANYAKKADIPVSPDLSGYALKKDIPASPDLSAYAKTADIEATYAKKADIPAVPTKVSAFENDANYLTAHQSLDDYAKKTDIPAAPDLSGYVTSSTLTSGYVTKEDFENYVISGGDADAVDLTVYAKTADIEADYAKKTSIPTIPTKVSVFENDANYLTSHQDLSAYALKTEIPTDANLSGYYSKAEVDALLANISSGLGDCTVSVTAGDNGTVKGASGKFFSGQSLTYTATPNSGYYFSSWSDGYSDNPRTIIIYNDITLEAQFAQNPLVTVTAGSNGSVSGSGNGRYAPGSSLSFTASPSDGYYFNKWSDDNTTNPRYINVYRSDITLEAEFVQNPLVTVTVGSNGSVSGNDNGRYAPGSSLSFTATPSDGYYFSGWSDGNTTNPRYINVYRSDITLEAEFVQNPLVTISAGSNGTVNTNVNGRYAPGSSVTITATPSTGYYFDRWSDGNYDNPRTITIGTSNVTVSAEFVAATIATVDLGLTSGNLWATCNVGAANPWNYGNYYAWGESETKTDYGWSTYKYCNGGYNSLTKYCNDASYGNGGFTDALTTLESIDDAATAVFGSDYSMPTVADWNELSDQCYWVWTTNYNEQNVSGYIVYRAKSDSDKGVRVYGGGTPSASYSLSDAHVFLPAAGHRYDTGLGAGSYGEYWSASLYEYLPCDARDCRFFSSEVSPSYNGGSRCCGFSVRPVRRIH